ncbi:MAG: anti-sigma F factor [Clostridia bacterium]|nr:anti-sigma F factor [Clostridia bacterium]MBR5044346.1 anti-sigma F factor [Clostridia bacterium]
MRTKEIIVNELDCVLPAKSVNEGIARSVVGSFLAQLDPTVEDLSDLKCAVSEAVTNAVVHGYRRQNEAGGENDCRIALSVAILPDRVVRVTVRDKGCGIEDVERARAPLFTTDHAGERSGMGFSVMEAFSDRMSVRSRPGRGTKVTLYKKMK